DDLGDAIDRDDVFEDAVAFARRAVIAPLPTPTATATTATSATAAATTTTAAPLASTTPAAAAATTTATTATTGFRGPRLFATRRDGFRRGGDRGHRGF